MLRNRHLAVSSTRAGPERPHEPRHNGRAIDLTQNHRDRRAAEPVVLVIGCFKSGADMPRCDVHHWTGRESERAFRRSALR